MLSVSKSSLLEQKKEQWAREREEMSHLYLPWGSGERYTNRLQVRNQFASTLELNDQPYGYQEPPPRQRSPSLPPIHHLEAQKEERRNKDVFNRNINSGRRFAFYDEDCEGDTSGYGSETVNHRKQSDSLHNPVIAWQNRVDEIDTARNGPKSMDDAWSSRTRSPRVGTAEEGRPKWGDRGVATGTLWEPTTPNARLPQMHNQKKGTPSWVERGLNMIENTAEVLVVDQRSSATSGFECDRSSYNGSDEGRSFLRGQNVPIEPEIRAQRENQRIKALELQSAILSQLEERERKKQEERERKRNEEKIEELRLQKQQEEERLRIEAEKKKNEEKEVQEQKKLETLKKALEDAEKNAKLEKEKRFMNYRNQRVTENQASDDFKGQELAAMEKGNETQREETSSPAKSHRTYDIGSARSQHKKEEKPSQQSTEYNSHRTTEFNSPRSVSYGNVNMLLNGPPSLSRGDSQYSILPIGINGEAINGQQNCIQLAVLVPQHLNNSIFSVSLNSLNQNVDSPDREKVLTPRKYRLARHKDATTQTDVTYSNEAETKRHTDKEYSNIDENAPQDSRLKKDRRQRSEERYKKDLENRPKWGVNRPVAQYKKQSEKDPFYSQKRKIRHKYRTIPRQYASQSSDDSRSPSPPTRSEKAEKTNKFRNSVSQSYWRAKRPSEDFTPITLTEQNANVQTDITYDDYEKNKMSPSKRLTLSQKFINDKYGNRKLWSDDNDKQHKTNVYETENRKKIIDQMNKAKKDYFDRSDD